MAPRRTRAVTAASATSGTSSSVENIIENVVGSAAQSATESSGIVPNSVETAGTVPNASETVVIVPNVAASTTSEVVSESTGVQQIGETSTGVKLSKRSYDRVWETADKKIPDFEPKMDVSEWIGRFKRMTALLAETDRKTLFSAKVMPTNPDWYDEAILKATTSDELLEALNVRFRKTPHQLRAVINARKQAEFEDPEIFAMEIKRLCKQYNEAMKEMEIIDYVQSNAHPKYAAAFIVANVRQTTLADTIDSLRVVMRKKDENQPKRAESDGPQQEARLFVAAKSDGRNQRNFPSCKHCGKTNHSEDRCYRRPNAQPERRVEKRPFEGKCYQCQMKGHMAVDCRRRKRTRTESGRNNRNSSDSRGSNRNRSESDGRNRNPSDGGNRRTDRDDRDKRRRSRSRSPRRSGNGTGGPA